MRLHQLRVAALGPFAAEATVDFDALTGHGIFLLTGPTGAGKTSVLDAVCYALFGAVPGTRQSAKRLRSDHAAADVRTRVQLVVTLRGRRLRITREPEQQRPKQRGAGTTVDKARATLEEYADGRWAAVSTRLDEIGHELELLVGMNREQFCQVVLLPQGDFAAFLGSDADGRRALLQRLFATERFEQVEARLKDWRIDAARVRDDAQERVSETIARLAEVGAIELPADADPIAWADDLRDVAHKQLITATAEAAAVRSSAQRARERHKAAEELATLQQQHANALRRRAVLDARRPDIVLVEHELTAARRAASVVPLVAASTEAASAHVAVQATARGARTDLAAQADPGPALAVEDAVTLGTHVENLRIELGVLEAMLQLERETAQRMKTITDQTEIAIDAAGRAAVHLHWLTAYDTERELRAEQLATARERAALVDPRRDNVQVASKRVAAAERRDLLIVRRAAQHDVVAVLIDRAQDARDRLFDLREQRISGMAAELAGTLTPGRPCPVCGSDEHPTPAPQTPSAVSSADEQVAHDTWNATEQERRAADEVLREIDATLAEARTEAGGDVAIADLEQALTGARAALAAAEESAAAVNGLMGEVTALEAERTERERERTTWLQREQAAKAAIHEATKLVSESESKLAAARASDSSVATRADRLRLLADSAQAVVVAARDETEAALRAATARAAADTAARAAGFRDIDEAADAARDSQRLAELESLLDQFRADEARVAEHLDNPALATAAAAPPIDVASALVDLDELETQLRALDGVCGAAKTAADAIGRLHERLLREVEALRPIEARCAVVSGLSRLADGTASDNERRMSLSSYVLVARLEQVAAAATVRLQQMSGGRYSLVHTDERDTHGKKSGLGLAVIDGWTGQQRPTSTLSGGESFFASLSLALGLADVVTCEAGGAPLETLFVDEGFGSLDEETLDEVMTVLDGLRDGGRVIGIVSHVAELRQRIPAQLQIHKAATGSTLLTG